MSPPDARAARRIQLAGELFKAWSSGDADAPARYFHPDGRLFDVVAGQTFEGWPAIRAFFAGGLAPGRNLELIPDRYWTSGDGVALTWIMSSTVLDDRFGAANRGRRSRVHGMSRLDFDADDRVVYEVDYWTRDEVARSLGVQPQAHA
jgi:hypothetical protein